MKIRITIDEFEDWLRERGYDKRLGEENLRIYLNIGLAGLFFANSALLMSCIYTNLGLPSERVVDRVRFELGRKVKRIEAGWDYVEIEIAPGEI
ncbi:hypothetical protein [Archaeoglobus veneficus]|uniref:Uncharacterized protein n=1 Tax=Archaeoglobus veneficus (strain DSM 11195 / SNP6) TaxID=693661 RepID=F2KS28_ARCVS|nr:hypothetical protein [Archaeoglobus veneficus]AEA46869.1 hypothetical protein Arcve_0855 [Archaeoglobus veneficus SNP6]